MKILLVHKFFRLTGGAEVFFFEVARLLKENGHTVAYFSTKHADNEPSEWGEYFVDPPEYDSPSLIKKLTSIKDIIYSKQAKTSFSRLIADFKPDLIHAFAIHTHLTPSVLEAAKEAGVPVVLSCNDYKHICPNYKIYDGKSICELCKGGAFHHAISKKCCKGSLAFSVASAIESYIHERDRVYDNLVARYLFASEFMLNKTKEFWSNKKVQYGVLKNPFNAQQYEPVYGGDYALYFGRIIDEKGVDRIVQAAHHTDIPIKIVGDGPDLKMLQEAVITHGLRNVEFLGSMWGAALVEVLAKARFVIVPSLWHENFPYVIFQSFAAGKPVVGSRRGGIPELVGDDERGILFNPDDTADLVNAMNRLWADNERCQNQGMLARKYVLENFSDEKIYQDLMTNYKAVLN